MGWKYENGKGEKVKALEETYLRWVLRVAGRTPGYLVREELQWDKLGERAEKRT